jgi:hypothetical protein
VEHQVLPSDTLIVPGTPARRTDPSAGPGPKLITHRGIIQVIRSSNNAVFGYVSRNPLPNGLFFVELDAANALAVTFKTDQTGSGTALNLAMEVCFELISTSGPDFHHNPMNPRTPT